MQELISDLPELDQNISNFGKKWLLCISKQHEQSALKSKGKSEIFSFKFGYHRGLQFTQFVQFP